MGGKLWRDESLTGCSPGEQFCWLSAQRSVRECKPLKTNKRRNGIARPTPSYGSTQQARTITLRGTLGTVAHSAVLMRAKLRPTKTACALGQVQNEGDPANWRDAPKTEPATV